MKGAAEWFKEKKKIIVVAALIALLILVVFLFFGTGGEESALGDYSKSDAEVRLTALLERIDGVGDREVMITEGEGGLAGGVIVCDGARRVTVRNDLLNDVSTALNINKNIIAIYSM